MLPELRQPLGILLTMLLAAAPARAEDEPDAEPKKDPPWQQYYQTQAAAYEFTTAGEQPVELELQSKPVMQWVSLNDFNGDVFVWTREGRPEVMGTIFSFPARGSAARNVMQEFHSLSSEPIRASGPGGRSFEFKQSVELKPIPGAPAPADTAARRRLQMRALARDFSAHMLREKERWELRLLTQPLYSYDETSGSVLGGAVFAFVGFVTDPEIFLLIEARETGAGSEWCYAAARFSNKSLWLTHNETEVWRFLADAPPAEAPYYLSRTITVGDSELP